jgi:hypothetical protein
MGNKVLADHRRNTTTARTKRGTEVITMMIMLIGIPGNLGMNDMFVIWYIKTRQGNEYQNIKQ